MTPEGRVKANVKKQLLSFGQDVWWFMPVQTGYGKAGVPDFVVCAGGFFLTIETKARGNNPTKLQDLCMKDIRSAGGTTLVINEDNLDEVKGTITWLLSQTYSGCRGCEG